MTDEKIPDLAVLKVAERLTLSKTERRNISYAMAWVGRHTSKRKAAAARTNALRAGRPRKLLTVKREPREGEIIVVHYTVNTRHTAVLALSWDNYDPRAIRIAENMLAQGLEGDPQEGFLLVRTSKLSFQTIYQPAPITENQMKITMRGVEITTTVLEAANYLDRETMAAAADLEQCAALAIAFELHPEFESKARTKIIRRR